MKGRPDPRHQRALPTGCCTAAGAMSSRIRPRRAVRHRNELLRPDSCRTALRTPAASSCVTPRRRVLAEPFLQGCKGHPRVGRGDSRFARRSSASRCSTRRINRPSPSGTHSADSFPGSTIGTPRTPGSTARRVLTYHLCQVNRRSGAHHGAVCEKSNVPAKHTHPRQLHRECRRRLGRARSLPWPRKVTVVRKGTMVAMTTPCSTRCQPLQDCPARATSSSRFAPSAVIGTPMSAYPTRTCMASRPRRSP